MFVEPMGKVERLYFMLQRLATPRPLDDVGRRNMGGVGPGNLSGSPDLGLEHLLQSILKSRTAQALHVLGGRSWNASRPTG